MCSIKVGGEKRNESFFAFFTFPQDWCEPRDNMRIETKSIAALEHDFVFTKDIEEEEEEAAAAVLPW